MNSRYICTGINYSHEYAATPFLAAGFQPIDLLYLAEHKPAPIPPGSVQEKHRGQGALVCRFAESPVGSCEADLHRQGAADRHSKAREAAIVALGLNQQALADKLAVPIHEVVSAYWVHGKTAVLPNKVRPSYVFAEVMRRFHIDFPEHVWLNAVVEPLADQLAPILKPGVTVVLYDSSTWHSRLIHEFCRLAGVSVTFLDDPLHERRFYVSSQPLWEPPLFFEPDEAQPTEDEVRSLLANKRMVSLAKGLRHPLLAAFQEALDSPADEGEPEMLPPLKRTSEPMTDLHFGEALRWAPRVASKEDRFDFGFLGEDEDAASVLCADSKLASAMDCCIELSNAYRRERIVFRPHRRTPPASLQTLYRCPNVYLANWSDEEMLERCAEIVSRTATNALEAEMKGVEVMWSSNVFYRGFELQKQAHQEAFGRFCRKNFQTADEILKTLHPLESV